MNARRILEDQRGASLVLALAFLAFMGVFSVSILAFTGVGSTTTTIVAARADQRYAADGGIEYGIANLVADTTKCARSGSYAWPATTVNGRAVTYACTWVSGGTALVGSPLLGDYGTIITGSSGVAITGSATPANLAFQYRGSVHSAGPLSFVGPSTQSMGVDGNLTVAGACPTTNVTIDPRGACASGAAVPALPALGVYVPSAKAAPPSVTGGCTTLTPGRYGTGGRATPTFSPTGQYYFASGVYYILDDTMTLQGTVFGGAKAASETQATTTVSPCRTSDPATGYSGSGVSFVLGGTGALRVAGATSHVELYSRVPGGLDAGATPGIAVWAGTGASVLAGSGAYVGTSNPASIVATTGAGMNLIVHGLAYVPTSDTSTYVLNNPDAGGASVFMGGLVTSALQVIVGAGDDNRVMTVAGGGGFTSAPRVVTLSATATGTAGAASTTISATVRPDSAPLVSDWRSQ